MARVLLVDDQLSVQLVLRQMLEAGGHTVVTARSGNALLNDLREAEYDVVITDLHMPVLDGWDVAAWLRERRPDVPVIAMGGDVRARPNAELDMFAMVLMKPFRRTDLLAAICRVSTQG